MAAVGTVQVVVAPCLRYFRSSLKKEEQLAPVLVKSRFRNDHRSADVAAEIVPAQLGFSDRGGVESVGLKLVVAPVFVDHPVKSLGAATDGNVRYGARTGAVFGAVVARQNAELANRIGIDIDEVTPVAAVVLVVGAIQIPRHAIAAASVDRLAA